MKSHLTFAGLILALFIRSAGGQTVAENNAPVEAKDGWSGSVSVSTYLAQRSRDFASPVVAADHGWLHFESRYNYEALKTGSLWMGYNFSTGEKLAVEATPMLGLAFGDTTGVAPGYNLSLSYTNFQFSTQGEYLFDVGSSAGNFFYTWSELTYAPLDWLRAGIVVERTKALGSDLDLRRGPLIAFSHGSLDFATYWLDPGSRSATFVFAVTAAF